MNVSTSVRFAKVLGQNDMGLSLPLTPMDTMRGVAHLTLLPQQQPQSQMPVVTPAYDNYTRDPL